MFAVIASPTLWPHIEPVLTSGEILFSCVEQEIDLMTELEKAARLAVQFFVIDLSALEVNPRRIIRAVRHYLALNETTRIVLIAPGYAYGDPLVHSLVALGIHDVIAPQEEEAPGLHDALLDALDHPAPFNMYAKWIVEPTGAESAPPKRKTRGKAEHPSTAPTAVEEELVVRTRIRNPGFRGLLMSAGWDCSGKSLILSNLAVLLAQRGAKVALVEGNLRNCELFSFFQIHPSHTGLKTLVTSDDVNNILSSAYSPLDNLSVFALPMSQRESLGDELAAQFAIPDIQDKLMDTFNYILIDNPPLSDETLLQNLKYAATVFLVVTPNMPKLTHLHKLLIDFSRHGINLSKFEVILNQYVPTKKFDLALVNQLLNYELSAQVYLPDNFRLGVTVTVPPIYPAAIETHMGGTPLVLKSKTLAKSLELLVAPLWTLQRRSKGLRPFK